MKITEFKPGDEIVRVAPAQPYSPLRVGMFGTEGGIRDRSYTGEKLIFIGIANGMIYLKRDPENPLSSLIGGGKISLSLDVWSIDWEYWVDPETLYNSATNYIRLPKTFLDEQIQKAMENEDYEEVARLTKLKENE